MPAACTRAASSRGEQRPSEAVVCRCRSITWQRGAAEVRAGRGDCSAEECFSALPDFLKSGGRPPPNLRVLVLQRSDQGIERSQVANLAEGDDNTLPDVRVGILQRRKKRLDRA